MRIAAQPMPTTYTPSAAPSQPAGESAQEASDSSRDSFGAALTGGTAGAAIGAYAGLLTGSPVYGTIFGAATGTVLGRVLNDTREVDAGQRLKSAALGAALTTLAVGSAAIPSHGALIFPAAILAVGGAQVAEGPGAVAGLIAGLAVTPALWSSIAEQGWSALLPALGASAAAGALIGALAAGPKDSN